MTLAEILQTNSKPEQEEKGPLDTLREAAQWNRRLISNGPTTVRCTLKSDDKPNVLKPVPIEATPVLDHN